MYYCIGMNTVNGIVAIGYSKNKEYAIGYKNFREKISKEKFYFCELEDKEFKEKEASEDLQIASEIGHYGVDKDGEDIYLTDSDNEFINSTVNEDMDYSVNYPMREIIKSLEYINGNKYKNLRKKLIKFLDLLETDNDFDNDFWETLDLKRSAKNIL